MGRLLLAAVSLVLPLATPAAAVSPLRYWLPSAPGTFDTHEADDSAVMLVAGNIYAPLVAATMKGPPQGLIAESWETDASGRNWRFNIRKGLSFDDGTPITPDAVLANFRRMLWLTKGQGLALNALLPGSKGMKGCGDAVPGLRVEGDRLVFEFARRPDDLFQEISEAIYGIANPRCFDAAGRWTTPFCQGGSGQYRVESLAPDRIVLRSRWIFPAVENAPDTVVVLVSTPPATALDAVRDGRADVAPANRLSLGAEALDGLRRVGFELTEGPANMIHFAELNAARGPFKDGELRRSVRDAFLDILRRDRVFTRELSVDPSFIPKIGLGWRAFEIPEEPRPRALGAGEEVDVVFGPHAANPALDAVEEALVESVRRHRLQPRVLRVSRAERWQRKTSGGFDAMVRATDLLVQDPYADLRLMFMSQVGAMIPDPSGSVPALIEGAQAADGPAERRRLMERLNTAVFDDAAVINFAHYGDGYLHSRSVDLSRTNASVESFEFRTVGWKPGT